MGTLLKLVCAVALGVVGPINPADSSSRVTNSPVSVVGGDEQLKKEICSAFARELGLIACPATYVAGPERNIFMAKREPACVGIRLVRSVTWHYQLPIALLRKGCVAKLGVVNRLYFDSSPASQNTLKVHRHKISVFYPMAYLNTHFQPAALCSDEGISRPCRFIGGAPSFPESRINQPNADHTQDHTSDGRKAHDIGPERGSLLRYQIIILAALFAGLIFLFSLSIRQAPRLLAAGQDQTGLICLFVGVTGIFLSVIFGGLLVTDLFRAAIYAPAGG